ncbi:hypothetical protein [Nonomuraea sp. KM88]|uniref:hypothetical protein n=1 Tax=Nonomuraea sp. KM88 TaxID=3457427 RepID=UPI003FCCB12B
MVLIGQDVAGGCQAGGAAPSPCPATYKETLAPHIAAAREKGAAYLFESSWKKPYSGHTSHTSLEIYLKITLGPDQETYDGVIDQFFV